MRHTMMFLFTFVTSWTLNFISADHCCRINSQKLPRYSLVESRARSTQEIVSRRNVSDVKECKQFALSKKALAFNYGRYESEYEEQNNDAIGKGKSRFKSCQALQCPEIYDASSSLIRDRNYKYYSMYSNYIPTGGGNLACVPKAGIFVFSNGTLNYTNARRSCQKLNGSLAHIISEERTNGFTKLIPRDTPVFVGLSYYDRERMWKNEFDEPLSCFNYRAWGVREPSNSRGCVGLVQPSDSSTVSAFWKVLPCRLTLHFICEIFPLY